MVVLPTSSRVVSLEIEGGKLAAEGIETLLELAQRGCGRTHEALAAAVAAHADAALAARGKISY